MGKIATNLYFALHRPVQHVLINSYGYWQAHQRFGGRFHEIFEELQQSQWLSQSEIEELQNERLRSIIFHAYTSVPYYKRLFDQHGIKPQDIKDRSDLHNLPLLTKEDLRNNFHELISRNILKRDMVFHRTSGTTGKPVGFYLNKSLRWNINYATLYRFYDWAGFHVGNRRVTIAGRFFTNHPPYWMINRAENQLLLSAHHITIETIGVYLEKVAEFEPVAIQGHPSAINELATELLRRNQHIPVKAILTTGEQLYPDQRGLIEDRFQCQVFDGWGQGEAVAMVAECEQHNGYHVADEYGIVEIVPSDNCGSDFGLIIGTSLHNYAMPFIRYVTGDLGQISSKQCPCGRGLSVLKNIAGRKDDILITPSGKRVLPLAFRTQLAKIWCTEQYQIIQESETIFRILLLDNPTIRQQESKIRSILSYYLGPAAEIKLEFVSHIPRTSGGKQRCVINQVMK
jgi:phenylacetate-CoA ligase